VKWYGAVHEVKFYFISTMQSNFDNICLFHHSKATGWGAFKAFEPLFERMFVKEPAARASIPEVQACLDAISSLVPLPPRPQAKLNAVAEAAAKEAQLAAKRAAAQQARANTGPSYHASRTGEGAKPALGANSAAARRLRGRQGPGAAPPQSHGSSSAASPPPPPPPPAATASGAPAAAAAGFDNAFGDSFGGSFSAEFGAAPTPPAAANNTFGDFGSANSSSSTFGDFGSGAPSGAAAGANNSFDNFGASTFGGSFDTQPNAFGSNRSLLGGDSSSSSGSSSTTTAAATFGEFGDFGSGFGDAIGDSSSMYKTSPTTNTTATDALGAGLGAPLSALSFESSAPPPAPISSNNNNLGLSPVSAASQTKSALPPVGAFGSGRGDGNEAGVTSFDSGRAGANWSDAWTGGAVAPPRPTLAPPMPDTAAEDAKRVSVGASFIFSSIYVES